MPYLLTVPDPVSGKPRKRATEFWKDDALISAQKVADRMNVPCTVLLIRTRGGNPKLVQVVKPQRAAVPT